MDINNIFKKNKNIQKELRENMLLYIFSEFELRGKKEVSYFAINKISEMIQKKIDLGYKFAEKILYSDLLSLDLKNLNEYNFINKYKYVYNGYLPKTYFSLTVLGKGKSKHLKENLPDDLQSTIVDAVENINKEEKETWRIFSRPIIHDKN